MAFLPIFSRPCTRPMEVTVLPSPESGGCGGGDEDELAASWECGVVEQIECELGTVAAEAFDVLFGQGEFFDDGFDGKKIFVS